MNNEKTSKKYSPLYFLAALGNGGLAVSFFIYLMFMVKHPDTPIPTFSHVYNVLAGGSLMVASLVGLALLGILYFSYRHFKILAINIREMKDYKACEAYEKLKCSNAEVTLMAIPLTYAMSVNVMFILGAIFVPGLWGVVQYLFPFALIAFAAIGIYALKIFSEYFSRLIIKGDFDFINNNNLSQLLSSFAFAMVAVGMAASAAMSHTTAVYMLGIIGAVFFATISVLLMLVKVVLGFKSIFQHGISKESAPSLWILIPIMTLLGITFVRVTAGIYHNMLNENPSPVFVFIVLAFSVSIQAIIGLIGYVVLNKSGYFAEYTKGSGSSVGSYALICPGVAAFVLGMFFIHWGLVKTSIITQFSPVYFVVILPLVLIQIKTIMVMFRLNSKMFCSGEDCFVKRRENIKTVKAAG